ncbi:hypothetical protein [Vibrio marisflavi]|uniref:Uncharacterized protein n=1 Tax=Vibrio marisflavi CECT 7928 TaxID=634439 RepID=A0ABM9A067_9VIBR|nr:hypothetical protein [Vibrio marisflavi]CAH0536804.1 hypothetical protein VMF7928_00694 [Vibrio marisflavi CECT 7928]
MDNSNVNHDALKDKLEQLVSEFEQFKDCSRCTEAMLDEFRLDMYRVEHDITSYFLTEQRHLRVLESTDHS